MYIMLSASYLAPGLGHSNADHTMASDVCSILTLVSLVVFCIIAAVVE